jgi:hypothetical protein
MEESEPKPPIAPSVDSVEPKEAANHKGAGSPKLPQLSPQVEPAPKSKTESYYSRPDPTPLWKILLEVTAIFVVLAYTIAAYRQLAIMNKTYGEIQKQTVAAQCAAKAAQSAADTASVQTDLLRKQLIGVDAAVIRPDFRLWEKGEELSVIVSNAGKFISTIATITVSTKYVALTNLTPIRGPEYHFSIVFHQILPTPPDRPQDIPPPYSQLHAIDMASPQWKRLKSAEVAMHVYGEITFDNGFGNMISQPLCWYVYGSPAMNAGQVMTQSCKDISSPVTQFFENIVRGAQQKQQ